jgi:hypothetical protein
MHSKRTKVIALFLLIVGKSFAQVGGEGTYDFLNLTTNPHLAALGGKIGSYDDTDLGLTLFNPALLNSQMHNKLTFSYVSYYAKVKYGSFMYSRDIGKYGTFGVGVMQVNYGSFIEADPTGIINGSFSGSDMAFNLVYAKTFDSTYTFAVNLKPLYSHLYTYNSYGVAADFGFNYRKPNGLFSAGIVFRNIGTMLKPYTPDTWQKLPFEIVAGFSKKLAHAPFRFVVTLHQLQNYSLYYKRPDVSNSTLGLESSAKDSKMKEISNEALSHLILGAEFVPFKSFCFRVGYNYQRRNELKVVENTSSVGFSWGFGLRVSKFQLSYGQSRYHLAGPSKYFSITTDLDDLFGWNKL